LRCRLESDYGFPWLRETHSLSGEPLDGFRIVLICVNGRSQLTAAFLGFGYLHIQPHDFAAHPLVLLDERKIPDRDTEDTCDEKEEDYDARKLVPDAEVHVHWRLFSMRAFSTEEESEKTCGWAGRISLH
jgi:hypothetical protein